LKIGFAGGRLAQCVIGISEVAENEASLVIEDIYDLEEANYYATCFLSNDDLTGTVTFKRLNQSAINMTGDFPGYKGGEYTLNMINYNSFENTVSSTNEFHSNNSPNSN
jgi:hypothetical protein